MADQLVTQVSQNQDQAKQAELARLQAAELAKKKEGVFPSSSTTTTSGK